MTSKGLRDGFAQEIGSESSQVAYTHGSMKEADSFRTPNDHINVRISHSAHKA